MTWASYLMRDINRKSSRFKNRYKDFLFRVNRKLNEGKYLDVGEEKLLKEIHQRATELPRLKW